MTEKKQYILGINLPLQARCHESGVALIDMDGNVLFAVNEERLSHKKLDGDFPVLSIKSLFEYAGVEPEEIKYVAVPTLNLWQKALRFAEFMWRERRARIFSLSTYRTICRTLFGGKKPKDYKLNVDQEQETFTLIYFWRDFLKDNFPQAKTVLVDHHLSHAAGAYFTSPWPDALVITADGAGNLLSSIVATGSNGKIKILDKTFLPHSPGSFWGSITKACGFLSGTRHGGKVTGLAAAGDPAKLIDKMREAIWVGDLRFKVREDLFFDSRKLVPSWGSYEPARMKAHLGEASREDIAAAAQQRLDEVITEVVRNARKQVKFDKVVLAGGVFANVLTNQKVLELPGVSDVYVFPAMSDGGLALGAALYALSRQKQLLPKPLKTAYLGPDYSGVQIENYLTKIGAHYTKMTEAAKQVASLINDNKVVALYQGRMEYGPRALGNRSILYAPKDPAVNDWLNKRLRRSEFMPFAPVTLLEKIQECYVGITSDPVAAKYMTITYQCTPSMKQSAPACVHLDGKARPQTIKREDNPCYYDILAEYHKLSGIPTIINTSYNMHEEPIVCTPEDAVRAFADSGIDYLVMENYLLAISENENLRSRL